MNIELIKVLEKTIDVLENNKVEYEWGEVQHCNCGILAQQALNFSPNQILNTYSELQCKEGIVWTNKAKNQENCVKTGLPLNIIFKKLFSLGLDAKEIKHLEWLSNPKILNKMGPTFSYTLYKQKEKVIEYMKCWIEILKEEQKVVKNELLIPVIHNEVFKEVVVYRTVEIDNKVKLLVQEELILN